MAPRRSKRQNKGVPPNRYGFEENDDLDAERKQKELELEMLKLEISNLKTRRSLLKAQEDSPLGNDELNHHTEKASQNNQIDSSEDKLDEVLGRFDKLRNSSKEHQEEVPKQKIVTMSADDLQCALEAAVNAGKEQKPVTQNQDMVQMMERLMMRQSVGTDAHKFDGNVQDWPLFLAWYENLTTTCQYASAEKLALLQKCLQGEAKETVRFLLYSPENVDLIMSSLEERYGQPEHLIRTMIAQIKAMPPVKADKPETLVKLSVALSNMVAAVARFNRGCYIDNPQLLDELLPKLPLAMQISWSEFCVTKGSPTQGLRTFSAWISVKAKAANYRLQVQESTRVEKKPEKGKTVATVTEHKNEKAPKAVCAFCQGTHPPHKCDTFGKLSVADRWNLAKNKKVCFRCLKPNHSATNCKAKDGCSKPNCKAPHHTLLHKDASAAVKSASTDESLNVTVEEPPSQEGAETPPANTVAHVAIPDKTLMKILPVHIMGPNGTFKVYAFLDEGSTLTLMKQSLADRLGVTGRNVPLTWQGALPEMCSDLTSRIVECRIQGTFPRAKRYLLKNVRTVAELTLPKQTVDIALLSSHWKHLAEAPVESMEDAVPEILIGLDNTPLISSLEVIKGPWHAPYLVRTLLGWVVLGKMCVENPPAEEKLYSIVERHDELMEMVKNTFVMESHDTGVPGKALSREDKRALEIMQRTTKKTPDGRFETGLLWKQVDPPSVPPSREMALKRLYAVEKKLDQDDELAKAYCAKMEDHLQKGYLVKLTDEDKKVPQENVWYLPHFPVYNPAKGKIRVVFDCAAKCEGVCLNDLLLTGPDMLKPLPSVLENFRIGKYGFTGDIREMFHRVYVRKEDTNYQRIFWRGMDRTGPPEEYKMNVMTFGATCSPTLAAYVKNTNATEHEKNYPEAVKGIVNHTYCDDYLGCANSIEEAKKLIAEIIAVQKAAGFEVVNWMANDEEILKPINALKNLSDNEVERVLGLWWNSADDIFTFKTTFHKVPAEILSNERLPSMREVLRLIMSIFDPLGFLAPFSIKGKLIFQELWRQKREWDDEIQGKAVEDWREFINELKTIDQVRIPRCYSTNIPHATSVQLHIFGDASASAIAAVAYLRIESPEGVDVAFVNARTKVAPQKPTTTNRLELQAAVLAARMGTAIRNALDLEINEVRFWTDSRTVMGWIRSDSRRYKQFVANRVSEIDDLTEIHQWKWVPGTENPADLATRNNKFDFNTTSMWFSGPQFLRLPENEWPQSDVTEIPLDECRMTIPTYSKDRTFDLLPNVERFSRWTRLIRATAAVKSCAMFWLQKIREKPRKRTKLPLSVSDLIEAEKHWFREIQQAKYCDEIEALKDPKHPATKLLIMDAHVRNHHQGREQVVNTLREKYWIPKIRVAVKSSWNNCQHCKNLRAKPRVPEMSALPKARVGDTAYPFERTGIDYFGPLMVKVGRRHEKRWGVLFTCMATRAVHLEVAHSLTTDATIMAIRRLESTHGPIKEMFCDNGTNLTGADNEFRQLYEALDESHKLTDACSTRKIKFSFNPPSSPHMGGSWERLVRSVKVVLKELLRNHVPTDEELLTMFAEVKYTLNSRPLTYVSVDPKDNTALTPNQILIPNTGDSDDNRPIGTFEDRDLIMRKAWRRAQYLADLFWRRWIREYLPELARRTKWYDPCPPIGIGDIVVVCDPQLPRNKWPMGRITDVFPGPDKKIRSANVQTKEGVYHRPVAILARLDVQKEINT